MSYRQLAFTMMKSLQYLKLITGIFFQMPSKIWPIFKNLQVNHTRIDQNTKRDQILKSNLTLKQKTPELNIVLI